MQLFLLNVQICNDIHLKTGKFNSNVQNQEKQGKKALTETYHYPYNILMNIHMLYNLTNKPQDLKITNIYYILPYKSLLTLVNETTVHVTLDTNIWPIMFDLRNNRELDVSLEKILFEY